MTRALFVAATILFAPSCQRKEADPHAEGAAKPPSPAPSADRRSASPPASPSADHPSEPPPTARLPAPPLPSPLPGVRTDITAIVGAAMHVAIGDVDGDGKRDLVLAGPDQLRVVTPSGKAVATLPVTRGLQVLTTTRFEGDKRDTILAGWGLTREHKDTTAAVSALRLEGGALVEQPVLSPPTSRQDVVAIAPVAPRSLFVAYFDAKYTVSSVIASPSGSGWDVAKVASLRMATSYARGDLDGDGSPELVVGRVYGDEKDRDGDAFVLAADGTRTPIPTTRGCRAVAVADTDDDGRAEVFLADGWHQNYGEKARGLVSWAHRKDGAFVTELIEDTAGQYGIEQIAIAKIGGTTAVVTRGNLYVRVFVRAADGWRGITIAGAVRDLAVGDLDGKPGDEIVLVGERSEVVDLGELVVRPPR